MLVYSELVLTTPQDLHYSSTQHDYTFVPAEPTALELAGHEPPWIPLPAYPFQSLTEDLDSTVGRSTDMHEPEVYLDGVSGQNKKARKPKARTLRDNDWEPYKSRIIELYNHKKLPLHSVQKIIQEERGFYAEYDLFF
jgi:hypothetical protein